MGRVGTFVFAMGVGTLCAAGPGCGVEPFVCASNGNCSGVEGGQCEASGFCSRPATECDSGRRYTELSGSLSGVCVPIDTSAATAGSGEGSADGGADGSATGRGPTGSGETGPDIADTGASSGPAGTASLGDETGDPIATDGSSGETGAPVVGPCGDGSIALSEDFSVAGLQPDVWNDNSLGTGTASVIDEALAIETAAASSGAHYWWSTTVGSMAIPGRVVAQVVEAPGSDDPEQVWVAMIDSDGEYYVDVTSGMLRAVFSPMPSSFLSRHEIPFDPAEHAWVRLTFAGTPLSVSVQTSPNGIDWAEFHTFDEGTPVADDVRASVGGGLSGGGGSGVFAVLDNLVVCEL